MQVLRMAFGEAGKVTALEHHAARSTRHLRTPQLWMVDPHVISALRSKRAELSGELVAAEKRVVQLRADIASLDGAIRVFDPTAAPDKIRPILRRKKPTLIPSARHDH
jgi:hypothetical protein